MMGESPHERCSVFSELPIFKKAGETKRLLVLNERRHESRPSLAALGCLMALEEGIRADVPSRFLFPKCCSPH